MNNLTFKTNLSSYRGTFIENMGEKLANNESNGYHKSYLTLLLVGTR